MKGNFSGWGWVIVLCCAVLQPGALRKHEDPVLQHQTGAVKYEEKMNEMKDGPKGAPTPSFQFYLRRLFLLDLPFMKRKEKEPAKVELEELEEVTADPQGPAGTQPEAKEDDDWWFTQWDADKVKKSGELDENGK